MSRIVRSSKYRHVFGSNSKKEHVITGIKITKSAWDSNWAAASNTHWALAWNSAGGGAFAVMPLSNDGRMTKAPPLYSGHTAAVLDLAFSPFNNRIVASVAEDCYVKIWKINDDETRDNISEAAQSLQGHRRKVGTANFHPGAENVLATSSQDNTVKIWDIEQGECKFTTGDHPDIINSVCWSNDGSTMVTICKDKKVRIFDPRTGKVDLSVEAHQGVKGCRALYLNDKVFTSGFNKNAGREFFLFDPKKLSEPIKKETLDQGSGILCPFYDTDVSMLYLVGKGDGNIRYYEFTNNEEYLYPLSEFKTNVPNRGGCFIPKTACNVNECEIAVFLKLSTVNGQDSMDKISFKVPRKSDMFQDDLYPPTTSGCLEPSMTVAQYFGGDNTPPKTVTLSPNFVQADSNKDFKPVVRETTADSGSFSSSSNSETEVLRARVSSLEAELAAARAQIKELEAKLGN